MKKIDISINDWCKFCGICAEFCPASALKWQSEEKPQFLPKKCSGCRLCALRCPDFAITVEVSEA